MWDVMADAAAFCAENVAQLMEWWIGCGDLFVHICPQSTGTSVPRLENGACQHMSKNNQTPWKSRVHLRGNLPTSTCCFLQLCSRLMPNSYEWPPQHRQKPQMGACLHVAISNSDMLSPCLL